MTDAELLAALVTAESPYLRALGRLGQLEAQRGAQYNINGIRRADYFPDGRRSYVQMMHMKVTRARATIGLTEPYVDSIMDLANYTIFAIMAERPND